MLLCASEVGDVSRPRSGALVFITVDYNLTALHSSSDIIIVKKAKIPENGVHTYAPVHNRRLSGLSALCYAVLSFAIQARRQHTTRTAAVALRAAGGYAVIVI